MYSYLGKLRGQTEVKTSVCVPAVGAMNERGALKSLDGPYKVVDSEATALNKFNPMMEELFAGCLGQMLAWDGQIGRLLIFQSKSFPWLSLCTPSAPLPTRHVLSVTTELSTPWHTGTPLPAQMPLQDGSFKSSVK